MRNDAWRKMCEEFNNSPIKNRIKKLPCQDSAKGQTLLAFWENKNKVVTKRYMEVTVYGRLGRPTKDLQSVRHLGKQNGFDILQHPCKHNGRQLRRGEYVFTGFNKTNEYWEASRRNESDLDWVSLKKEYGNRCATCGSKEGQKHFKTKEPTRLEKGHMDPSKPMSNKNIIPQCSYCNRLYRDKFKFDRHGNIKSPTPQAILGLTEEEKREIYNLLERWL